MNRNELAAREAKIVVGTKVEDDCGDHGVVVAKKAIEVEPGINDYGYLFDVQFENEGLGLEYTADSLILEGE